MSLRRGAAGARAGLWLAAAAAGWPERTWAEDVEPGVVASAVYTADVLGNVSGGVSRGVRHVGKLEAGLEGQTRPESGAVRWALRAHHVSGARISRDLVGDTQVVSNLEAPGGLRLSEAWVARDFGQGAVGLKLGVIDLNTEFDVQETGGLFLNSSHGVGPDLSQTGLNGPSIFPTTGLGLTARVHLGSGWRVRGGLFDGVPGDPDRPRAFVLRLSEREGALAIGEAERRIGSLTARLGAWSYTTKRDALDEPAPDGRPRRLGANRGAYAMVAAPIGDLADAWFRVGGAPTRTYPIGLYLGGGVVRRDVWISGDALGVAVAHARFGRPARGAAGGLANAETAVEATYRLPVGAHATLQPTVQFIHRPSGQPSTEDALVVGMRFTAALSRAAIGLR